MIDELSKDVAVYKTEIDISFTICSACAAHKFSIFC